MRKTLALILSVIMTLSVCSFAIPASAAEGTAINTAEDFANMAAEGNYYLNADITLTSTYANPFNGTFDGNGHTVTISSPMFLDFSGTIKNLKIKGEVVCIDTNGAAVALASSQGFVAENIENNANVTVTGVGVYGAGILAYYDLDDPAAKFTNIVNNGEVYVDSSAPEKPRSGGIAAVVRSATFTNCVNNGKVSVKGNIGMAAGICPRTGLGGSGYYHTVEAYYCVNNGDIYNEDTYVSKEGVENGGKGEGEAGGIFGYVGSSNAGGLYKVHGCINTGDIHGTYRTGGIVAYTYCSGTSQFILVEYCVNTGDIYYGRTAGSIVAENGAYDYASGILGYANSDSNMIRFNIDAGKIQKVEGAASMNLGTSFYGCSSKNAGVVFGNYILNIDQYTYLAYASAEKNVDRIIEISVGIGDGSVYPTTIEDLKSGKVAYELNKLADEYDGYPEFAFYQNLGTDELPTPDATHGWVLLEGDKYVNGEKPSDEETTEPEDDETTEPEDDETTEAAPGGDENTTAAPGGDENQGGDETTKPSEGGCGGVIAGGIALVAILGTALIIKKRD